MGIGSKCVCLAGAMSLWLCASLSVAQNLSQDASGVPLHFGREIPKSQYLKVSTKRLANAKVLWINNHFLAERGYLKQSEVHSTKLNESILDAWAWVVPAKDDAPQTFRNEEKNFYATRYGGGGLGVNQGDGRAAAAGAFQIKGIGRTPLVKEDGDNHANGKVSLEEAMREAFWGEINNAELPFGANRVVAIIDRGTSTTQANGVVARDVLVVREDSVRPAHFMSLPVSIDENSGDVQYKDLSANTLKAAQKALPGQHDLEAGLREYVRRIATQYATAFAKQLYHGATSQSNIEISGRFLDYGTETAQPGHGKIKVIDHNDEAGDNTEIKTMLIDEFAGDLLEKATDTKQSRTILRSLNTLYDHTYETVLRREFLARLVIPEPVLSSLEKTSEGQQLGAALAEVATKGAKSYVGKYSIPEKVTIYDFSKIATLLADHRYQNQNEVLNALHEVIADQVASKRIAALSFAAQEKSLGIAVGLGFDESSYFSKIKTRASRLNQSRPSAYRWLAMKHNYEVIDQYTRSNDPLIIQRDIDASIRQSLRDPIASRQTMIPNCKMAFGNP